MSSYLWRSTLDQANSELSFQPGLISRYNPELDLLVRSTLWAYSVGTNSATFGQKLLFMSYDHNALNNGYKLQLHFVCNVLLKYLKDIVQFRLTHVERVQEIVSRCENLATILSVLTIFRFLKTGQRPSLTNYLLGLDNISYDGGRRREIGYNYITRELIWSGFMVETFLTHKSNSSSIDWYVDIFQELLTFSLPFINYHTIKRKFRELIYPSVHRNTLLGHRPVLTLQSTCIYCGERPTLPYHMGCSHIFCYYCLKVTIVLCWKFGFLLIVNLFHLQGNKTADANFKCPSCSWQSSELLPV